MSDLPPQDRVEPVERAEPRDPVGPVDSAEPRGPATPQVGLPPPGIARDPSGDASTRAAADPADATVTAPGDVAALVALIRLIAIVAVAIGTLETIAGLLAGEPRAVILGAGAGLFGIWIAGQVTSLRSSERESSITRIAVATLILVGSAATLQPSLATAMAIGSLLPAVIVTPIVRSRIVLRLLVLSGFVGAWSVLVGRLVPASGVADEAQTAVAFLALVFAYAFLAIFLWEVSRRLKDTAAGLRSVITMSGDLARTLDPRLVGDRIAVHIGRAVGADDCALSYWDRATDRVVTLGYDPPERRVALNESYPLGDYPATRRVLLDQRPLVIEVDDPGADPAEAAYLRSIGQRAMAMIPLVAAGRTIGLVEVTSVRKGAFDERAVELALMLAGEAAMALENARLYDQIRHQALHDWPDRARQPRSVPGSGGARASAAQPTDRRAARRALHRPRRLQDPQRHPRPCSRRRGPARSSRGGSTRCSRPSDTAARLGGDEFAVLIEDVASEADALRGRDAPGRRAARSRCRSAQRGRGSRPASASPSAAPATRPPTTCCATPTWRCTPRRARPRAAPRSSGPRSATAPPSGRLWRPALRGVEERGELRLDYQPIVELATSRIDGVEALVRWHPSDGPVLMPSDWIDLAEESGDIVPIGRWVLREACRQARDWQIRLARPELRMSVNLSARQFREHDIVATVRRRLDETGLPPASLTLEITESSLMRRTQATIARLDALRDLGVRLAIDDFGTGYSSLSYLERFPIDILKIDRTFVSPVGGAVSPIARAIIDLGRTLKLEVIAEGIEHLEQARGLADIGCRFGQGYLYARPMAAAAIEALLAEGDGLARPTEPERAVDGRDGAPRLRVVGDD